jgi:hypothetical protein
MTFSLRTREHPVSMVGVPLQEAPMRTRREWICWLLTLALLAWPAHADTRAEVEAALDAMARAVMARDVPGYMQAVAPDDTYHVVEQRHWIEDVVKHPPESFAFAVADGPSSFEEGDARAEFRLRMTWRMPGDPADKPRVATFPPVVFTLDAGRWVYRGEKWEVLEGRTDDGALLVKYLPGDEATAADVMKAFPVAKRHVDEGFEVTITRPLEIKLYKDMQHLKATVYPSMPDPVLGGWYEPGESIKFMDTYTRGVGGWTGAFAHEYAHTATAEFGPHLPETPWWVVEGVAELSAEAYRPGYRAMLDARYRRAAADETIVPWEQITSYHDSPQPLKQSAYTQGHHMMGYVSERWGRRTRNLWVREMASGKPLDEATRRVLQMPFADLDRAWRASLVVPAK